jgi:TM2 domain-containing membrane protein YozV
MKKSLGRAYLLFALSLFGLAGLHTIYLGKPVKGVLFLIATWAGLFALTTVLILPRCSPRDWTAYAACYWGMVVR